MWLSEKTEKKNKNAISSGQRTYNKRAFLVEVCGGRKETITLEDACANVIISD